MAMKLDVHLMASVSPGEVRSQLVRALKNAALQLTGRRANASPDTSGADQSKGAPAHASDNEPENEALHRVAASPQRLTEAEAAASAPKVLDVFENLRLGVVEVDDAVGTAFANELAHLDEVREVVKSVQSGDTPLSPIKPTRRGFKG